ncbi:MAG: S8 family serine peptidase [Chthoniobacterales bacterium]|nr:S8 family serine peptidase [Chthoniobacterales bacterium]
MIIIAGILAGILAHPPSSILAQAMPLQPVYHVWEAGMERYVALDANRNVWETNPEGYPFAGPFPIRPAITIETGNSTRAFELAEAVGASEVAPATVGGFFELRFATASDALAAAQKLYALGYKAEPAISRPRYKRFSQTPSDPYFPSQWHLQNTGQLRARQGMDANVVPAWATARGRGIYVAIADDGVEVTHKDLLANSFPVESNATLSMHYDFENDLPDPFPVETDYGLAPHGTAVAGIVAAASNTLGGLGIAPNATIGSIITPQSEYDDDGEAQSLLWKHTVYHIYNNSWGPPDDGITTEGPGQQTLAAIEQAVKFGRNGRGVLYTWAGGNGRQERDDSNYDGYANSIYTIAVGGVSDQGLPTSEAETGANLVVAAPTSSLRRQGLITTDLSNSDGYNSDGRTNDGTVIPRHNVSDFDFTNDFGMTSGATPVVSGVLALMLEANPNLGWRDAQEILIRSARRINPRDRNWKTNSAGLAFHPSFGAGLVDAAQAVALARTWANLPPATRQEFSQTNLNLPVQTARRNGAIVRFDTTSSPELRVEHVQFEVELESARNGVLSYVLTSPSGMRSEVPARPRDTSEDFGPWTFMSVRHWGESSRGTWTLQVFTTSTRFPATLLKAKLILHGTPR